MSLLPFVAYPVVFRVGHDVRPSGRLISIEDSEVRMLRASPRLLSPLVALQAANKDLTVLRFGRTGASGLLVQGAQMLCDPFQGTTTLVLQRVLGPRAVMDAFIDKMMQVQNIAHNSFRLMTTPIVYIDRCCMVGVGYRVEAADMAIAEQITFIVYGFHHE